MNDSELRSLRLELKAVMDSPLFDIAFKTISADLALEILNEPNKDKREDLYYENKALDRVIGKLKAFAGNIVMEKKNGK